jgi:hypothetical protein
MRDGEVLNVDHDTDPQILRLPDVGFDAREILHPKVIDKHYATRQELFPTTQFLASDGHLITKLIRHNAYQRTSISASWRLWFDFCVPLRDLLVGRIAHPLCK